MCGKGCTLTYWQEERKHLVIEKDAVNKAFVRATDKVKQSEIDYNLAMVVADTKQDLPMRRFICNQIDQLHSYYEMVKDHTDAFNEALDKRIAIADSNIKKAEEK